MTVNRMEKEMVLTQESFDSLIEEIRIIRMDLESIRNPIKQLYTNKTLKEKLGVGDKLIKQYRDKGFLSYTQVGDKYWYSQEDVDKFLSINHIEV